MCPSLTPIVELQPKKALAIGRNLLDIDDDYPVTLLGVNLGIVRALLISAIVQNNGRGAFMPFLFSV